MEAGDHCGEAAARGVQDDLGWALATVLRSYVRSANHALAGLAGGTRGYQLLAAVARDCPRSQLALAHHVGLDRTVVTYLLDDLAAAGLLERQADPGDRRTRRVVVTPAGVARLAELDERLCTAEAHVLRGLGSEDRVALRGLLRTVATAAAASEPGDADCPVAGSLAATSSVT